MALVALGALAAVALACALVLALTARGGDHAARAVRGNAAAPPVALIGGHALQQAECADWLAGSMAQRGAILTALTQAAGGAAPGYGRGATMPAQRAEAVFATACASPIARHWLLYELYNRAAAFQSAGP